MRAVTMTKIKLRVRASTRLRASTDARVHRSTGAAVLGEAVDPVASTEPGRHAKRERPRSNRSHRTRDAVPCMQARCGA